MGTGGNFDDELELRTDGNTGDVHVDAHGPAYGDDVVALCVWIVQKKTGEGDAAAAQITTKTGKPGFKLKPDSDGTLKWELRALQASTRKFEPGPATAMAIALFLEDNKQQARLWAQTVELK